MPIVSSLAATVRKFIFASEEACQLSDLRRSNILFSQGNAAEKLYFVDSGLIKLTRTNGLGGRIILSVRGVNDLLGEEALSADGAVYKAEAEVISAAQVLQIDRQALHRFISTNSEVAEPLLTYALGSRDEMAEKVELLCLHDVEYRVLYYLARLCEVVAQTVDGAGFQIPITQLELADMIGATRETTSTVLNQLERRGLLQLSRRMLTVPALAAVQEALGRVHEVPPTQAKGAERAIASDLISSRN